MVMRFVSSASYSFLINARICGKSTPLKGIHPGDPISSYLFILAGEALLGLLSKATKSRYIHGARTSKKDASISHIFFNDDSLIFARATREECLKIVEFFNQYEEASC